MPSALAAVKAKIVSLLATLKKAREQAASGSAQSNALRIADELATKEHKIGFAKVRLD